ncbi:DUF2786 domain-containing protein [Streptosporangiaceae bacterium NEAU-GS5]|nr:DUF2786 domain-containing protein [Streptosporangiaceae bacterium NEAU-GS5]
MGKPSRAEREAKRKEREQQQRRSDQPQQEGADRHSPWPSSAATHDQRTHSDAERARHLIGNAVDQIHHGDREGFDLWAALLAEHDDAVPDWTRAVDHELTSMLTGLITTLWRNGWQPADVTRLATRRGGRPHAAMAADLIALELRAYAPATMPPRWTEQLDALDAATGWDGGYFASRPGPRLITITYALQLLQILMTLPRLERLGPIPGQARAATTAHKTTADDKTLTRVRALLAQAESTSFEAEAETFTAAAQRLMAKHSIDVAMLDARADADRDRPAGIRLGIDAPYEQAKATLLAVVAGANRCRAIWSRELGFSTVLGFDADLDAVELLFTSLLVQATTAIVRAGTKKHGSGQSRTRSFRESFLHAFTSRIGERLEEATAETVRDEGAARGSDLVPLLIAREAEVEEAVEAMFPELTQTRMRGGYDREGWAAGRAAADQAHLSIREQVSS